MTAPTRRQTLRAETLGEIRRHAAGQIADGGVDALSLNAIAKAMGMTGPAIYRYFASRDELVATLIGDGYVDLADTLERAAEHAPSRAHHGRLRAIFAAWRAWALADPHRYRLIFTSRYASGAIDPERIITPADRAIGVLVAALAREGAAPPVRDATLRRQLAAWGRKQGTAPEADPGLHAVALQSWTRLHGILTLELEGVFAQMEIDADRFYDAEVDALIASVAPS